MDCNIFIMARSKRKAIYKDKGIRPYWRFVKSRIRQSVRDIARLEDREDYNIPNPKEIINDYDYSDYTFDCEYKYTRSEWEKKLRRK